MHFRYVLAKFLLKKRFRHTANSALLMPEPGMSALTCLLTTPTPLAVFKKGLYYRKSRQIRAGL